MKSALYIELSELPAEKSLVVVVIDNCGAIDLENLVPKLRALDPNRREMWEISQSVTCSFAAIFDVANPSARSIMNVLRSYVGMEKSRRAAGSHARSLGMVL